MDALLDNGGFSLIFFRSLFWLFSVFLSLFRWVEHGDICDLYSSLNLSPSQSHFVLKAKCNDYGRLNFMRDIFHPHVHTYNRDEHALLCMDNYLNLVFSTIYRIDTWFLATLIWKISFIFLFFWSLMQRDVHQFLCGCFHHGVLACALSLCSKFTIETPSDSGTRAGRSACVHIQRQSVFTLSLSL